MSALNGAYRFHDRRGQVRFVDVSAQPRLGFCVAELAEFVYEAVAGCEEMGSAPVRQDIEMWRRPGRHTVGCVTTSHPSHAHLPAGFLDVIQKAIKQEAGPSRQRKHHLVASSYLERWSDEGKIRVTEVDTRRTYVTSAGKAARETDYYRLESPDVDPNEVPPLVFETMLSVVEGYGKRAIDDLLVRPPSRIDPELMMGFVWYLAFQLTRGKAFRREQQHAATELFRLTTSGTTDQQISTTLGRTPTPAELAGIRAFLDQVQAGTGVVYPQTAAIIGTSGAAASELCRHILFREWQIFRTPGNLVTCDEPVVVLGGSKRPRGERAGVETAAVILFPLAPQALLALFRKGIDVAPPFTLNHAETAEINQEIIANATQWAFERSSRKATTAITVPPLPANAVVTEGPFPELADAGQTVYRAYRPSRWANATYVPPLPVARWGL